MEPYILYLNVFVILNLALITVSILFKRESQKFSFLLAIVVFICLYTSLLNLCIYYFQNRLALAAQMCFLGFNFSFGCVISAYATLLYGKKLQRYWMLHLLPCVFIFLFGLSYLFISEAKVKDYIQEMLQGEHLALNLLNAALLLHILGYLFFTKIKLRKFNKEKETFTDVGLKLRKKWANDFLNYSFFSTIGLIVSIGIAIVIFEKTFYYTDLVLTPIASLSIYVFIVFKNFQFAHVYDRVAEGDKMQVNVRSKQLFSDSQKSSQNLSALKDKIEAHMIVTKSYTNPGLGLQKLANELDFPSSLLSQVINQEYGVSFFDYINKLRTEEAKKLLLDADKQHFKVEAIGEMAGFSSRSSFFAVFKKHTGLTPSTFKAL
jgi:AraC-like DNA-binding protein